MNDFVCPRLWLPAVWIVLAIIGLDYYSLVIRGYVFKLFVLHVKNLSLPDKTIQQDHYTTFTFMITKMP